MIHLIVDPLAKRGISSQELQYRPASRLNIDHNELPRPWPLHSGASLTPLAAVKFDALASHSSFAR
jgi:hypothetical protein